MSRNDRHFRGYTLIGVAMVGGLIGLGALIGSYHPFKRHREQTEQTFSNINSGHDTYIASGYKSSIIVNEFNYQSKNSGNSNNGTGAGAKPNPGPDLRALEDRVRVSELKTKELEDKLKQSTTPAASQTKPESNQTKPNVTYKDANIPETGPTVTVYQDPNNQDIIMIYTGRVKNHKKSYCMNQKTIIDGKQCGFIRYMPIDIRRDNVESWPSRNMSLSAFVSNYGQNFMFEDVMYSINSFESPTNQFKRSINNWTIFSLGSNPRSGSYFPPTSGWHN